METIPCPGCRTDLDPSATVCPICLRGRGKIEITRAYATLREMKKRQAKRPFVLAGYFLAAAAASGLLYRFHAPLLAAAASSRTHLGDLVELALYPPPPPAVKQAPPPPAETPPAASGSAFAVQAPPSQPARPAAPASPAANAAPMTPSEATPRSKGGHVEDLPLPALDSGSQWAFYGRVFDVITLQPVPNVQLRFASAGGSLPSNASGPYSGSPVGAPSDSDGRFIAVLSRLQDGMTYEVRALRAGYASTLLYESDIPYAKLSLSERREIARNAQDGDMTAPPLTDVAGEPALRRDVFVAPTK
jgi:hypothetical protein